MSLVFLALLPTVMVLRNLPLFDRAPEPREPELAVASKRLSILIPARNEAESISASLEAILAQTGQNFDVVVLDDHSEDATAKIVSEFASKDPRVRLAQSEPLPDGWNGKQHACWQLARLVDTELLLFLDADVRLQPNSIARLLAAWDDRDVQLLSGFPDQETKTLSERLLIPLMHVVLLGYLPLDQMRSDDKPQFAAGCGQMFLTNREAYLSADGHKAICNSRHDGLKLPRSFRTAGLKTDLMDASDLAVVRMYQGWEEVKIGLLKNATEGIASRKLIIPFSILLLGGFVLPLLGLAHALFWGWPVRDSYGLMSTVVLAIATFMSLLPRAMIASKLKQNWIGVVGNPFAVLVFVGLQWVACIREMLGKPPVAWRGRT